MNQPALCAQVAVHAVQLAKGIFNSVQEESKEREGRSEWHCFYSFYCSCMRRCSPIGEVPAGVCNLQLVSRVLVLAR
jgi:hypothetical protein